MWPALGGVTSSLGFSPASRQRESPPQLLTQKPNTSGECSWIAAKGSSKHIFRLAWTGCHGANFTGWWSSASESPGSSMVLKSPWQVLLAAYSKQHSTSAMGKEG